MKNTNKRNNLRSKTFNVENFPQRLVKAAVERTKMLSRQMLSLVFIYALVFVPLLKMNSLMPKTFAQFDPCVGTNRIFQHCSLGGGQVETDMTEAAIDDVIEFYKLPASDRARVMSYGRNEIRAMLYPRLLQLIKKENPTTAEQQALGRFAARIKQKRIEAAQQAQAYYNNWNNNPCQFQPPSPFSYDAGASCYPGLSVYFAGPNVPSFEEFQQFGAATAYQDLYTTQAQDISAQTTQAITLGAGVAFAIVGTTAAALIGSTLSFATIAAIFPYSGITFTLSTSGIYFSVAPAAGASSGSVGAAAVAGPAAVIILALTVAVMRGLAIANQNELPGKLQEAINNAQNQTLNLRDLTTTDSGNQEIYGAFLMATLPDFPGTDVPAPVPSDRKFEVRLQNVNGSATINDTISYQDWDGNCHTARLSGAWFVDSKNGVESQALRIRFRNWNNENWIASRNGGQFYISKADDPYDTKLVDELPFRDCNNNNIGAKIKFEQMTVLSRGTARVNCDGWIINPDPGRNFEVGAISTPGDTPGNLTVQVNGGTTATVNNITVRNLTVTDDYKIMANVTFQNAATPTTSQFTVTVRNTVGQEVSTNFSVQKSAIVDTLPLTMPTNLSVGDNFEAILNDDFLAPCFGFGFSVSSSALPPGVTLQNGQSGRVSLAGYVQSGGKFQFEISKTYTNGEVLKHSYIVFVKSDMTALPNNVVSWWRAENDAEDFTGAHKGTLAGSVSFDDGKAGRAFKFDGSNGYVALPSDTFSPSLDFTFELWFKTATRGVILGRQRVVEPYDAPSYGATPAIYVDQNGKLKVQMFNNVNNTFTMSANRVDDNAYHHVAVVYFGTAKVRMVFLDGVNIGTINLGQSAEANNKYQIGTGYVNDGFVGGMTGWFNFNGLIDEPTLYNRALSEAEIKNIYVAGDAGKISLDIFATPPLSRDAANASITINADGGAPPLNYSIDGGTTFQNTNSFTDLTAGSYTIVVKDGRDRTITRQVSIDNPPPTLSLTSSQINPTCNGAQTGEIRLFATGGSGNYEYSVLNGANVQTSNVFTQLNGGTYTPWVRDVASNTVYTGEPIILTQPAPIFVSPGAFVNAQINQPYSQTFNISGGTSPFTTTASGANPANGWQIPAGLNATADANSITISGTPTVDGQFPILLVIKDRNGCTDVRNYPLTITSDTTAYYSVSGRVTNGGQGLQDVTVMLGGAGSSFTFTDASGNFTFTNVFGGNNYTISASLSGVTFAASTLTFNNLSANVTNADFTTETMTYEGDIVGRPTGDGSVNVLDMIMLGRMIAISVVPPSVGGEWQRTDVAPGLGDGLINNTDLNQLGRYAANLDALRPATGPSRRAQARPAKADGDSSAKSVDKQFFSTQIGDLNELVTAPAAANLSVGSVSATSTNAVVPVRLNSNADTAAIQFTVDYDPSKLSIPADTAIINRYSNTTFLINNNTPGKLGIVAYQGSANGVTFSSGTIKLFDINFAVVSGASGTTSVGFGGDPVPLVAADSNAGSVNTSAAPGTVTLLAPTAATAALSGRVITGRDGLSNAIVTLTDQSGAVRITRTSSFGYFHFYELPTGATYVITVTSKRYSFNPQMITLLDNVNNLNFVALE